MKLLVQGDDFGFTKGVTYGIVEAIDNGILTCTGMFTNMEIAPWAAEFIKQRPNFCFGIDFNLVSGPCCSNPQDIPSLVDENGYFIRSSKRIHDPRFSDVSGREELFPYEQVYREIRAQYNRFIELTGRKPLYLNPHSITCETIIKAIHTLSEEENVPFSMDYMNRYFSTFMLPSDKQENDASTSKKFDAEAQLKKDPLNKFLNNQDEILKHDVVLSFNHPGYVDADLFKMTSLSIERCKDLEFVTSPLMLEFVKKNKVELIDYRDIVKL
ncbi:MAG: ChbG/HpnK family deacetylase [Traorella sp.]